MHSKKKSQCALFKAFFSQCQGIKVPVLAVTGDAAHSGAGNVFIYLSLPQFQLSVAAGDGTRPTMTDNICFNGCHTDRKMPLHVLVQF